MVTWINMGEGWVLIVVFNTAGFFTFKNLISGLPSRSLNFLPLSPFDLGIVGTTSIFSSALEG